MFSEIRLQLDDASSFFGRGGGGRGGAFAATGSNTPVVFTECTSPEA